MLNKIKKAWTKRILPNIEINSNDCWVLKKYIYNNLDYGQLNFDGKKIYAHRISLMVKINRLLNENEHACHKCDNPICVNPEHLWIGNPFENSKDRTNKGRTSKKGFQGESHPMAKLNSNQVDEIRNIFYDSNNRMSYEDAGKIFNVTGGTISRIVRKHNWK